jgi:hypothetical protein
LGILMTVALLAPLLALVAILVLRH